MSINESIIDRIRNPQDSDLQELWEKAKNQTRERLSEAGRDIDSLNIENFAYAYYYDWRADNPDYMFLVQNPGLFKMNRHGGEEVDKLKEADALEAIEISKEYSRKWLKGTNRVFSERFFDILRKNDLIEYQDWKEYLESQFFDDFILTDVIKYRVSTEDIESEHAEASFEETLEDELKDTDPEVVFCFSSRAWKALYRNMNLELEQDEELEKPEKVTKAHGMLFRAKDFGSYIIPLSHFSGQNNFLRDAYYRYLDEGLEKYRKLSE